MIQRKGSSKVYVCSVSCPEEYQGKQRFVMENYGIPEENIRFVDAKSQKLDALRALACQLGVEEGRIALVDDTVKTLDIIAGQSNFVTVHVSSLFAFDE